ncbi:hypothetical protein [Winogradskyella haliclonae]|uniref:Uncharacterized protein n=1 Tax=Winogradskyella haliclonae TaxID=2048558 RepID=A0ABQ2C121_9FLAO|nr:hypothetical protein [Winogradskyella haliclonae]GGI57748.1 hypothetical protein GCM10011444_20570 [Winogradskyella haliclonae]
MTDLATKKDWFKFVFVMIVFIIGMIIMMLHEVKGFWIWTAYVAIWWWTEMIIAKNIHLKWYVWVLILLGLTIIDVIIIALINS